MLLSPAVLVVGLERGWWHVAPHWDPFVPLRVDHPLTPVTRWKLSRIDDDRAACLDVLAQVPGEGLEHLPLADYTPVAGCPLENVVRVERTGVAFNRTFTASCPLLVAWLMFERQALQSLAVEMLGTRVREVHHYGSFACRNIYGRENGRRSRHASASALDVAGFRFENGASVWVRRHWQDPAAPERAAFLRHVRRAACRHFGTVLGPDYNAAHADHFHFDTAPFGACR